MIAFFLRSSSEVVRHMKPQSKGSTYMNNSLSVTVAEMIREFQPKGLLLESFGDVQTTISGIVAVEDAKPGDLVFVDKKDYLGLVRERRPAAVVTAAALREQLAGIEGLVVLIAPNVALAHALIKQRYAPRDFSLSGWLGVHSSAVLHETVFLGEGTVVEPRAVIGCGARIGKNCRIMAGVVIENDVVIGDNSVMHPNSVIGYRCRLGNDVVIGSGSVVGSEGYGFAQDKERKSHPIPQTGIVVIEDRVRIGANNCIDRAAYRETRIGAGTKLDNLCHIAHNVVIGEDCLLTSMLCVAGSSQIGNRVITSGQTGIIDHVNVCDDAVLLHRAGVTKDVEKPGAYAGLPLQPISDYMKTVAAMKSLAELRKRVAALEQSLEQRRDA